MPNFIGTTETPGSVKKESVGPLTPAGALTFPLPLCRHSGIIIGTVVELDIIVVRGDGGVYESSSVSSTGELFLCDCAN